MKIIDNIQIDTQNLVYEENGKEHVVATNEEVNSLSMCPSNTKDQNIFTSTVKTFTPTANGWIRVAIKNCNLSSSNVNKIDFPDDEYSIGATIFNNTTQIIFAPVYKGMNTQIYVNNGYLSSAEFIHAKEV